MAHDELTLKPKIMRKHFSVLMAALAVFMGCDNEKTPDAVAVTGVKLNHPTMDLVVGGQGQLTATIEPKEADNQEVVWKSEPETIATVVDGVVTAEAEGQAVITVTTVDGGFTATCTVDVTAEAIPVDVVILSKETLDMVVGDAPVTLEYELRPQGSVAKSVTWSSEKEDVATVVGGVVTALSAGTTDITINADGKTDICKITVTDPVIPVERVELSEETLSLAVGDAPVTLTYTLTPSEAAGIEVQWSSENESVATVVDGVVTAVGKGTTDITIDVDGKTDICVVTVTAEHPIFGEITFKTATVWEIKNAEGVLIQTWSDAVMGSRCKKDEFNGGTFSSGPFLVDCRQNPGYGDLFSWEAVNQHKADLCPDGWEVPVAQDFLDLYAVLNPIATSEGKFAGLVYVEKWGGEVGGKFQNRMMDQGTCGYYWTQSQNDSSQPYSMYMYTNKYGVTPNYLYFGKEVGEALRCIKK